MTSYKPLPPAMIGDIDALLESNRATCISIYPEAEKLRRKWEEQNVALEDVVSAFVERCGVHSVAVSFDRRSEVDVLSEESVGRDSRG